jgi:CBS domain-containing protein
VLDFLVGRQPPVVTCLLSTILGEVISLLSRHRMHRIFVVDPTTKKVLRVITVSDILQRLQVDDRERAHTRHRDSVDGAPMPNA